MKRIPLSVAVAVVGALGALIVSAPAFRVLLRGSGPSAVRVTPVEIEKLYSPSGWMGDATADREIFQADFQSTERARPGDDDGKVMRFGYQPGRLGWAGVAWLYPNNNWGDLPGLKIHGGRRLSFWASGAKGNETLEFKLGGAHDPTKPYRDSFEKALDSTALTQEWHQYTIDLSDANLNNIIVGFMWVVKKERNPTGVTFFLDSLRIE